jgi:CMP-N,N'-diacetyllegionaminic acid synthase
MRVLGIVPARAGSKRLPGKNTAELGGKPLWRHAVDQAKGAGIEAVVVSTNDPEILAPATNLDIWVSARPDDLARDDTPMLPVVVHTYEKIKTITGKIFDAVCILQPTSPFRTSSDIVACIDLMKSAKGVESVVSVFDGPDDLAFQVRHANRLERLPTIVIPNGAIYLLRVELLEAGEDWYGDFAYCHKMPRDRSLDINVAFDLEVARLMYGKV